MSTADAMRERTETARNGRYWTIDAYIEQIDIEIKRAADQGLTHLKWMPFNSCPNAIPDQKRIEKIAIRLRKRGFTVTVGNHYDNRIINICWNKRESSCIIV